MFAEKFVEKTDREHLIKIFGCLIIISIFSLLLDFEFNVAVERNYINLFHGKAAGQVQFLYPFFA